MWILNKLKIKNGKEDEKMKFRELADEWLNYKKNTIKESSYYNYMLTIEKHLKPRFENANIEDINNYNDFVQELLQKLDSKTVRRIINTLKSILNYYEDEYNCKLAVKRVSLPKIEKDKIKILTKKEKTKLVKYCLEENELVKLGIIICLYTGLRIGEICALKWENIDLVEKKIFVKNTLQRVYDKKEQKTKVIIDKPKSETSIRAIPMSSKLYNILQPLKKKYKDVDYILSGTQKYIEPRNYQYTFKQMLKKCKVKKHKFHELRHTFASNCIEVGMDIKSLSEILGHSDVSTTLRTYVHSSDKQKKKFLEKL